MKAVHSDKHKIITSLGKGWGVHWPGRMGRRDYIKDEETFRDDRYVHCLDCSDGFISAYICQNLPITTT